MKRGITLFVTAVAAALWSAPAAAETPLERGTYLMNSIVASRKW